MLDQLPDAPLAHLGVRIRRPLDDLLTNLVHDLRSSVRTSKAELVELALLAFAGTDQDVLADQVREFRSRSDRYMIRR